MKSKIAIVLTIIAGTATASAQVQAVRTAQGAANAVSKKTAAINSELNAQAGNPTQAGAPAQQPAKPAADGGSSKPQTRSAAARLQGKRDPFVSIIRSDMGGNGPSCGEGRKCLVISRLILRGIVRSADETIAVVDNGSNKTYFLREGDPVFNGAVVKITANSMIVRERIVDRVGRVSTRDVVKQIPRSSVLADGISSFRVNSGGAGAE